MEREQQGHVRINYSPTENYRAFIPFPLPPAPPLVLDATLNDALERANRAMGRLDGITSFLPDIPLFLYFYVRKEAVLSSQIEGTQSSLSDLLLYESHEVPGVPLNDVQEVSNYVAALTHGIRRIREENAPLTLRLMREIHGILLSQGRGADRRPGEFRTSQNWIGGSRPGNALFVPPPPGDVPDCMSQLEKFIHDVPQRTPTLLKAALAHVQFETIHPFLDGNGRLGRLLITLLLCYEKALDEPLLYLSLYFKSHRNEYYDLLQKVRRSGDWEAWMLFFCRGVEETSEQATQTAQRILRLFDEDRHKIGVLGRIAGSALRIHHIFQKSPLTSIQKLAEMSGLTQPTVSACLKQLETLKIVRQTTERQRNRIYVYDAYMQLLSEGTEPLKP